MHDLAVATFVARIVDPASKLATARVLDPETATSSLGTLLGLAPVAGIATAARGRPGPANRDRTVKALGRKANRRRVEKHFDVAARDDGMDWARSTDRIAAEARMLPCKWQAGSAGIGRKPLETRKIPV